MKFPLLDRMEPLILVTDDCLWILGHASIEDVTAVRQQTGVTRVMWLTTEIS